MKRYLIFVLICSIFTFSSIYFAASIRLVQAQSIPTNIELSLSSNNPIPGQTITITARSYSVDLNGAKITWKADGKVVQDSVGGTIYSMQAPPLGKRVSIDVSAVAAGGRSITGSLTIESGSVDMLVESDGYVPPLFRGKLYPAFQNNVKIIAIPHIANTSGTELDPKTLVYQWKRNGQVLDSQSGYGKQTLSLQGDIVPRPYDISVAVSARDGIGQAAGLISLEPGSPSLTFYVDDPLYGPLFNRAITDTIRIGSQKEIEVLAVPYGFNKPAGSIGNLELSWNINGTPHNELSQSESVILRAPSSAAGSSDIAISIRNTSEFLQRITGGFSVIFNSNDKTSTTPIQF